MSRVRGVWVGLVVGAVLGVSAEAADDPVWTWRVREVVDLGPTTHLIRLAPAPPGIEYPRTCDEFVIRVDLQAGRGVPVRVRHFFDEAGYERAIQKIRQVQTRGELLRLGSLERGFALPADAEGECEVLSHGLGILVDLDHRDSVFSVY